MLYLIINYFSDFVKYSLEFNLMGHIYSVAL